MLLSLNALKKIVLNFQVVFFTELNTHAHSAAFACDSVTSKVNLAKKVQSCRFSLFKFPYKSQNMCFRFD